MKVPFDETEVRRALSLIIAHGSVFEVRALDAKLSGKYRVGTVSGYFNNVDASIAELGKLTSAKGIYVTLNPVNPVLLARRANRLDYASRDDTTKDQHIVRRRWLLVDVDADRPSGISATNDEKEAAHKKARAICDYLKSRGWQSPIIADSGNGYHLRYRVDLACEDDRLTEKVLTAVADRFDGDGVEIDRSVHNPARIARLYGTLAAKGDNTKERHHRLSKILNAPLLLKVTTEQLQALVDELQPAKPARATHPVARNVAFCKPDKAQIREMLAVIPKRPDYPDWIKIVAAVGDALPAAEAIEVLDEWSPEETPGEYAKKLASGFNKIHCSTLIHEAKKHGCHLRNSQNSIGEARSSVDVDERGSFELPPPPAPYVPPPLDLLPLELQEYVHAAAESLNVDRSFILLPLLSSLGTAIGNSRSIRLKRGFIQPPVVWTGIVGRSGARKSPAIELGCPAVMDHERKLMQENKVATEIYAEEVADWESKKGKKRGKRPDKPPFRTCTCDDLTIEVLADILMMNPRGVLVRKDELSHWLAAFDQYKQAKGSDVSRWLSLHTAVALGVDRRTDSRHYRIVNPRVSITGGIQPQILRRVLTPEFYERGLPARFVLAYPPFRQDKWSEATVPDDLRDKVLNLFSDLWLLAPGKDALPVLLPLAKDAKAVFVDFYNGCGEAALDAGEYEEAAWGKLTGYGARLALVSQLAHNPRAEEATRAVVEAACGFARWSGKESARIYAALAETEEQRNRRELIDFVQRRGGRVTVRDTMQNYWRLRNNREQTEWELNALVRAGFGKWEDSRPRRGKPARVFRLVHASTSTRFPDSRGKIPKSVDVPLAEPNIEAVSNEADAFLPDPKAPMIV